MIKTNKKNITLTILALLVILLTVFIWCNSAMTGEDSGDISEGITAFVYKTINSFTEITFDGLHHLIRKTAHFTEFMILGMLYCIIKSILDTKPLSLSLFFPLFCTLVTGVIDEFIQSFIDGRGSAVSDVLLDFSGAVTGIAIITAISLIKFSREKKY